MSVHREIRLNAAVPALGGYMTEEPSTDSSGLYATGHIKTKHTIYHHKHIYQILAILPVLLFLNRKNYFK